MDSEGVDSKKSSTETYRDAGVDIDKGDRLASWIKQETQAKSTPYGQLVSDFGGFADLFRPDLSGIDEPCLVGCTDGVGTKLLLALESNKLDGLGQDLVAMCLNDLYCTGAKPLFFLDYYATGALDEVAFKTVLQSIRSALAPTGCFLLGGETAEMPGLYGKGHFDLAGFSVGLVDRSRSFNAQNVRPGDRVIGFSSSGFHSNGYSLIRKWLQATPADEALTAKLLQPTRVYSEALVLAAEFGRSLKGLAHITGGGISGNLPRVLPTGVRAKLDLGSLATPKWMRDFIAHHNDDLSKVETVFNMGCGMCAIVSCDHAKDFLRSAETLGLGPFDFGAIEENTSSKAAHVTYTSS